MDTNQAETWAFWLNLTNPGQLNYILAGKGPTIDRYISIGTTNVLAFRAYHSVTDGDWISNAAVTSGNKWIHVAVTYDGTSVTNDPIFYIDGEKIPLTNTTPPAGTLLPYDGDIYVGYENANGFEGYISDAAFYNTVLTGREIREIYGNGTLDLKKHGPARVASNLILWWRMGDGAGDTAATIIDQMGNANLSAVNAPTIIDIAAVDCFRATAPAGPLAARIRNSFALPDRSGKNSNQTVFVNRFAVP